jgi:hypothetical protein
MILPVKLINQCREIEKFTNWKLLSLGQWGLSIQVDSRKVLKITFDESEIESIRPLLGKKLEWCANYYKIQKIRISNDLSLDGKLIAAGTTAWIIVSEVLNRREDYLKNRVEWIKFCDMLEDIFNRKLNHGLLETEGFNVLKREVKKTSKTPISDLEIINSLWNIHIELKSNGVEWNNYQIQNMAYKNGHIAVQWINNNKEHEIGENDFKYLTNYKNFNAMQ